MMHQVEIQNHDEKVMWRGQVQNNRDGFNALLEKIHAVERSNNDSIIGVFINPTGTYHVPLQHFLESNRYRVIYVDPRVTDYARKMENLGKEKSDKVDSAMLASVPWKDKKVLNKRPHVRDPISELTRLLEVIKKNTTRITNVIASDLAVIFPEFTVLFPDITSKTSLALLEKFPTPKEVVDSGLESVLAVMQGASRYHFKKDHAEKLLIIAVDSVGIPDTMGVYTFRIRENVKRLNHELSTMKEIEERILKDTQNNEDVKRLDDIKGIGPVYAASMVSEIGDIKQFDSALKLQSYGGKAPLMTGSGGKNHAGGISRIRNPHLSNAAYETAVSLVANRNEEFFKIFEMEMAKGKERTQAYMVVSRRLLYHVYSILKNKKPYRQRIPAEREGVSSTGT
jgi:transposase